MIYQANCCQLVIFLELFVGNMPGTAYFSDDKTGVF